MRNADRLQHVQGTWLPAADLRDVPGLPAQRLARHHVAAHRTWGVSGGLAVTVDAGHILVTAGAAVDRCGRTGILPRQGRLRPVRGLPVVVVLTVTGDGPHAVVRLREPGGVRDLDVPLATIDDQGTVQDGDTHRQWLRRPGPAVTLAGVVAKGAPVTGVPAGRPGRVAGWMATVDLGAHHLTAAPAVIAGLAGTPPRSAQRSSGAGLQTATVEVDHVTYAGFELIVRSYLTAAGTATGERHAIEPARTAPFALSWLAVLPADRPPFPATKE